MPSRLRLLCVGPREPSWASLTLQLDAEGCLDPQFRWVSCSSEALSLLRDQGFDCVVISDEPAPSCTEATSHDPFALVRAIRASGYDDPIVLVSVRITDLEWAELCRQECEVLVSQNLWDSMALVSVIKRAISRIEIARDNRQLALANHRRLLRERDEAEHLLQQQRQIVAELEGLARSAVVEPNGSTNEASDRSATLEHPPNDVEAVDSSPTDASGPVQVQLPDEVNEYYHELLRTYVIMGSGNLGVEIAQLAQVLAVAGLGPREALELHLERVETLVRGLGNRSTRHVMARADLLALELVIHLGESHQRRLLGPDTWSDPESGTAVTSDAPVESAAA